MPLNPDAVSLIRKQFEVVQKGQKPQAVVIGTLTEEQLNAINGERAARKLPLIVAEIKFQGRHIYQSRVVRDGYSIEDVIDQIRSALGETSEIQAVPKMTALVNRTLRQDRYGNNVRDHAVLECTNRHPYPELFSVIPKGDAIKPAQVKAAAKAGK